MRLLLFLFLKKIGFLILFYSSIRLLFNLYNLSQISRASNSDLFYAYLMGLRFDLSAIGLSSGVFFLFWIFLAYVSKRESLLKASYFLFFSIQILLIALNVLDLELIHFAGQRLTINYFAIMHDLEGQAFQVFLHYWPVVVLFGFLVFILIKFFPRMPKDLNLNFKENNGALKFVVIIFCTVLSLTISIRGGFQNKPLRVAHAYRYNQSMLGHLSLNSTFTFLMSGKRRTQSPIGLVPDEKVIENLRRPMVSHFRNVWSNKQNVVILIVESLSMEYMGDPSVNESGYTPFLNQLAHEGIFIRNFYANGRRSIEAVPSILAGIPSLLPEAFLTSNFQGAEVHGLGEILRQSGYTTAFFHGAENGSMFFDSFTKRVGFEQYYGLSEYPNKQEDYDGFWGIFDEPFLQFAVKKLNDFKEPFGVGIFTLSSHQPYSIPKKYEGKFLDGPLPIHRTIRYADYAIEKFFESAMQMPWFKNTLFVITGDHTSKSADPKFETELGQYRVPLLLFHPQIKWPNVQESIQAQHVDITPTVLDVLDLDIGDLSHHGFLGHSIFDSTRPRFIVNRTPQGFWYLNKNNFLKLDDSFSVVEARLDKNEKLDDHLVLFESFIQYTINGLVKGRFFDGRPSMVNNAGLGGR